MGFGNLSLLWNLIGKGRSYIDKEIIEFFSDYQFIKGYTYVIHFKM